MKLPIICTSCTEAGIADDSNIENLVINDSGKYKITCPQGHTYIVLWCLEKFQTLFEIGVHAIIDGYYREAVSSFTSSLERFYEFFTKIICISKKMELSCIQDAWKEVSSQSERQLGAFIFIHSLEFGSKPALLPQSKVKFRNAVIHKGTIPSEEEAIKYGQAILDVIRPLLIILREDYQDAVDELVIQNLKHNRGTEDFGMEVLSVQKSTILSLDIVDPAYYQTSMIDLIKIEKSYRH